MKPLPRLIVISLVLAAVAQAQTFTTLYNFTGGTDGGNPVAGVVQDAAGHLYGTAAWGGDLSCNAPLGCGVVFEVTTAGTETVLHTFTGGTTDGAGPNGLLRDKAGNLYGTTTYGGRGSGCPGGGCGTVFELTPVADGTWREKVLYSFTGGTTDGCYPQQGLVEDRVGNLYGTTFECGAFNSGTVFKVRKNGKEALLHTFEGASDGAYPQEGYLIIDANGSLYGVANQGGLSNNGVLYKLSNKRKLAVLHTFTGGTTDGCFPYGTPAMDKAGSLYGATAHCGSSDYGTVWRMTKKGAETILHHFTGYPSDGNEPVGGVVRDSKGNLYGETSIGGAQGWGALYGLSKSGTLTLLHSFSLTEGGVPYCEPLRDAKGGLYGTTSEGGGYGYGTVWSHVPQAADLSEAALSTGLIP